QCARANSPSRAASARSRLRLVMKYATSAVVSPLIRRSRSTRTTWANPGQSDRYPFNHVEVVTVRFSSRPCPLSMLAAGPAAGEPDPQRPLEGARVQNAEQFAEGGDGGRLGPAEPQRVGQPEPVVPAEMGDRLEGLSGPSSPAWRS